MGVDDRMFLLFDDPNLALFPFVLLLARSIEPLRLLFLKPGLARD
jgi:hypothetical protein